MTYDMTAFFQSCETMFERTIMHERGVALQEPADLYAAAMDLILKLSSVQAPLEGLQRSIIKQPPKAQTMQRLLRSLSNPSHYCEIGFDTGASALVALQTVAGMQVHSFEGREMPVTVPSHDFLDARYVEQSQLHIGSCCSDIPSRWVDWGQVP